MSMLIAALIFIPLLAVSMAHVVWAFGGSWPIRDRRLLARTVVGTADVEDMPPRLLSLAVAIGTLLAGVLALALADHDSGGVELTLLALPVAALFLARGSIGYTRWWIERTPEPGFRINDRRVYSPLCLVVGAGFLILVVLRLL